jgi:hypothetical protein
MAEKVTGYKGATQKRNIAWFLPRPKPDNYKGGMPLYCENWLVQLACDILEKPQIDLLNLFCGMNSMGFRVDLNPEVKPDLIADAHTFAGLLPEGYQFDVCLADPPYSNEEAAQIYGTPKLKYKLWTAEVDKVLKPGGLFIIYHKFMMPNPNPERYYVENRVFIGFRVMHLPRVAIYYRKYPEHLLGQPKEVREAWLKTQKLYQYQFDDEVNLQEVE